MNLLILGAGQYGFVAKEVAEAMGCFQKIDFLDDNNPIAIGKINDYEIFRKKYEAAIVAIGNSQIRLALLDNLKKCSYHIPTLIHPKSYVSPSAKIGEGCIVEPFAGIHTEVVIDLGCLLSMNCVVNHNAVIEKGCHVDCGAIIPARAVVKMNTKVFSGTVFEETK